MMRARVIVIENEADYRAALDRVHRLMDAETPEEVARLRAQALLVAAWEQQISPPVPPDPVEAIRFRMEQLGLGPRDLVGAFGTRSRVSEILSGKRKLTLPMIRRLHERLGIPAEVLIRESKVGARGPAG